jgi:hypothetical protein
MKRISHGFLKANELRQPGVKEKIWQFLKSDFVVMHLIIFMLWAFVWDIVMFALLDDESKKENSD